MANETSIIKIQYDTEEAVKNINRLTDTIANQRARQEELKKELKEGKISQRDYATQMAENKQSLSRNIHEQKKYINIIQAEAGSVKRAKAENQILREERNKLGDATGKNKKLIEEYNKRIDANTKIIAGNVDSQSRMYMGMNKLGDTLESMPGQFGGAIKGIIGMTKAGLAFIATPIGAVIAAIVVALKALQRYFKGSEDGQNKLNKVMAVFKSLFNNLDDIIQRVGKAIFDAISNPRESIIKLGNLIKENLINRFKAFGEIGKSIVKIFKGDFKEGFKELAEGAIQLGTGIEDSFDKIKASAEKAGRAIRNLADEAKKEANRAMELADAKARLDKIERRAIVTKAENAKRIADLILISRLETSSNKEKMDAIKEAQKIKEEELRLDLFMAKERLRIREAENEMSNSTKEDLMEEAQLRAQVYNVQKSNSDQRRELVNREIELNNRIRAEENKTLDELEKGVKNWLDIEIEIADETIEIDNIVTESAIENLNKRKEAREQEAELRRMLLSEELEGLEEIIRASQNMADSRVVIASSAFAKLATINTDEIKSAKDAYMQIAGAAKGLTSLIVSGHAQEFNSLESEKQAELLLAGENLEQRAVVERVYAKKMENLKKKQFEDEKKKALLDAAIATSLAVVKGLASGLPLPGLVMAALAGILGGVQIASIKRQNYTPTPTFEKGGMIGGRSHAKGGTKFWGSDGSMFEAEAGESAYILNKDATSEIAALSAINEKHSGKSFSGSGSSYLEDGGKVDADTRGIEQIVNEKIAGTPIFVSVASIEDGMTKYRNTKEAGII